MTTFYCNNIADSLRVDVSTGAYVLLTPSQETTDGTNVNVNTTVKIPITIAGGTASFTQSVVDCQTQLPHFLYTVQIFSQGAVVYDQTGVAITGASYNLASFVPGSAGGTSGVTIPTLQTNGTNNTDQLLLNLVAGSNITLSSDSSGDVTITGAASGVWGQITGTLSAQTDLESALTTLTNSVTTETTRAETAEALLAPLTSAHLVTPLLGTPTSGNLANCTFPTLNQNTTGSAATAGTAGGLTGTPDVTVGAVTSSSVVVNGNLTVGNISSGSVRANIIVSNAQYTAGTPAPISVTYWNSNPLMTLDTSANLVVGGNVTAYDLKCTNVVGFTTGSGYYIGASTINSVAGTIFLQLGNGTTAIPLAASEVLLGASNTTMDVGLTRSTTSTLKLTDGASGTSALVSGAISAPSIAINGGTAITSQTGSLGVVVMQKSPSLSTPTISDYVGIGGGPTSSSAVRITGTGPSGGTVYSIQSNLTISSLATTAYYGVLSNPITATASFAVANLYHFAATDVSLGAGSSVTNQYAYYVPSTFSHGGTNYGFYSAGAVPNNLGTGTTTVGTLAATTISGNPNFSGTPTATTQGEDDNSTKLATTAFAQGFNPCNPANVMIVEEFMGGWNQDANVGILGWRWGNIGSAGVGAAATATYPNFGIFQMSTNASPTAGQGAVIFTEMWASSAGTLANNLQGSTGWEIQWIFKLSQTTDTRFRVGFDTNSGYMQGYNGIHLRYDTNASYGDTTFVFETTSASTATSVDSTIAVDTNWHRVKITSTTAGTATFTLYDGSGNVQATKNLTISFTTSLGMSPVAIIGTDSTAQKTCQLDFFSFYYPNVAR